MAKTYLHRLFYFPPKDAPYKVPIVMRPQFITEVNDWLNENDIDCWFTHLTLITSDGDHFCFYFKSDNDAMIFRLRWG